MGSSSSSDNSNYDSVDKYETLTDEAFWNRVAALETIAHQDDDKVVVCGNQLDGTVGSLSRQLALSCSGIAYIVLYLTDCDSKIVLDLGCGIGGNSMDFLKHGSTVHAIDKRDECLDVFERNAAINRMHELGSKTTFGTLKTTVGDIVTTEYPKSVDIVLALDVLSYISPACLKETLAKIKAVLSSSSSSSTSSHKKQFAGTLFFTHGTTNNHPVTILLRHLGACFCKGANMAREIIRRSGFRVVHDYYRLQDGLCMCWEFVAEPCT